MPSRAIHSIVIHCSASANGVSLGNGAKTSAQIIDGWHANRVPPFQRDTSWRNRFNPQFGALGYHFVIDVDGMIESARHLDERGAHVAGHNINTIGLCCVGTDKFTMAQWRSLRTKCVELLALYPHARVCGHRDLSPDTNRNGVVEPNEWLKTCPGFDVTDWWLMKRMLPMVGHIFDPHAR